MPLETGTTISALDDLWPLGGDQILEGDNHLRLIKAVLKAQFPGEAGEGLASVISATEAEMNYLVGVTSNIQAQIDALSSANDNRHPIDSFLFTANTANPSTYGYSGTWVLIEGGVSINTADTVNDSFVGIVNGENDVDAPLLAHSHPMPHSHTRGTMEISGDVDFRGGGSSGIIDDASGAFGTVGSRYRYLTSNDDEYNFYPKFDFKASRNWTGNTSQPSSSTTSSKGTSGATINVQGKKITLLCWKRTA